MSETAQRTIDELLQSRERFVAYVARRVSDPDLAQDIGHDSLVRALKAGPQLRDTEALVPWFYRILRNAVIDLYRKRSVESARLEFRDELPEAIDMQSEEGTALCECFRGLLPGLRPEYAQMIDLLELRQEPTDVVAARLGVTAANLKVRRHRARQALRRELEQVCGSCADGSCLACDC